VQLIAAAAVALVAALHLYFLVLEMFLWTTPFGRRTFGTTAEFAASTKALAANQGLYNGFLAAGLVWGLVAYGVPDGRPILTFFLVCIVVAGIFGAATVSRRILLVQAVPALLAGAFLWLA
jgi:putative membrane protein